MTTQKKSNIPFNIKEKIGRNLYMNPNHPIGIIKNKIYDFFGPARMKFEGLDPHVSVKANFDDLLIPKDHPSRSKSDTFYSDEETVLRTHTSAHQSELISKGHVNFLVTGDVYRRDEIDSYHYPVFHQMEGVTIFQEEIPDNEMVSMIRSELGMLIGSLFPGREYRMDDSYFPFTNPSAEIEVNLDGKWVEVLGCGKIRPEILANCGLSGCSGWAFGLGLERLAMILFEIPDIRYFWTSDERFEKQFSQNEITKFKQYSQFPFIMRDISFYYPEGFEKNDFYSILNSHAHNLVSGTHLLDNFTHPKTGRNSYSFRIVFESLERTLTNDEVNEIMDSVNKSLVEEHSVEMR